MVERGHVVLDVPRSIEALREAILVAGVTTTPAPGKVTENVEPGISDFLTTDTRMAAHISEALAKGDAKAGATAIGDAARALGMARIASEIGLGRESLFKALSEGGNPTFDTVLRVC